MNGNDKHDSEDEPADAPTWPGVQDYDAWLGLPPEADPVELRARILGDADETLGALGRVLRPLHEQLRSQLDDLLALPTPTIDQPLQSARLAAITRTLDQVEALMADLGVEH